MEDEPQPEPEVRAPCPWYFVSRGRRYVVPYHYTFRANVRARWVGRTLVEAFDDEFPFQAPGFHQAAQAMGQLSATSRDGEPIAVGQALRLGDTVSHVIHTHEPSVREPAVAVIAADHEVVVVCKSASLPVHPCGRFRRNTVVELLAACHGFEGLRAVHRLDRVTSGVVVLARTKAVAHRFSLAIQGKTSKTSPATSAAVSPEADVSSPVGSIRKEYFALVVGAFPSSTPLSPEDGTEVVCEAPLAVDPVTKLVHVPAQQAGEAGQQQQEEEEKNVAGRARPAQAATTRFRCLGNSTWSAVRRHTAGWGGVADTIDSAQIDGSQVVSLVHCVPVTGRTHQIRCASLALARLPLIVSYRSEKSLCGTECTCNTLGFRLSTIRSMAQHCRVPSNRRSRLAPTCLPRGSLSSKRRGQTGQRMTAVRIALTVSLWRCMEAAGSMTLGQHRSEQLRLTLMPSVCTPTRTAAYLIGHMCAH